MSNRTLALASAVCYALTGISAVAALAHFVFRPLPFNMGWLLVLFGAISAIAGIAAQNARVDVAEAISGLN